MKLKGREGKGKNWGWDERTGGIKSIKRSCGVKRDVEDKVMKWHSVGVGLTISLIPPSLSPSLSLYGSMLKRHASTALTARYTAGPLRRHNITIQFSSVHRISHHQPPNDVHLADLIDLKVTDFADSRLANWYVLLFSIILADAHQWCTSCTCRTCYGPLSCPALTVIQGDHSIHVHLC